MKETPKTQKMKTLALTSIFQTCCHFSCFFQSPVTSSTWALSVIEFLSHKRSSLVWRLWFFLPQSRQVTLTNHIIPWQDKRRWPTCCSSSTSYITYKCLVSMVHFLTWLQHLSLTSHPLHSTPPLPLHVRQPSWVCRGYTVDEKEKN